MVEKRKTLAKSITIGCVSFITILGLMLGIAVHFVYRQSLYQRYQSFISNILHYVDRHIDDDDLRNCTKTITRSSKYDELELFMDGIMEDFDIHYLYIITPIAHSETNNVMSIISAEDYQNRYIDTEGNLYLGWIAEDEYDLETVEMLFSIMKKHEIVFFEETTEWGTDYTGALTLCDSNNIPYAILAVDVDITDIKNLIRNRTIEFFALIFGLGAVFTVLFLQWAYKNITAPVHRLETSVVAFAKTSHDQRSAEALKFEDPGIHTGNEVESLSIATKQMTEDMKEYIREVITAETQAKQMSELANKDALTGIRNKTAYDKEIKNMEYDLKRGSQTAFGISMVDLNFLKKINDTYGHEQGNIAIKKLCFIVCKTFAHSPVFRIGGDEFVIILKGQDYENYETLVKQFKNILEELAKDEKLEPWEKVSAAIGTAFYDQSIDANVANVFSRADQKMYECKKEMKSIRES